MSATGSRDMLQQALAFELVGKPAGNVTIGRGRLDGASVHMAFVENRFASGSIGSAEAVRLQALLRVVAIERSRLVLHLDSAGAKVSEGLAALGAFRHLFRAGLDAALAGAPIAAILGRNCFGGSSMLAHLARRRLFAPDTRLGMSGPAVLAAAAGMDPLDEMFAALAQVAMAPAARSKTSPENTTWQPGSDLRPWLREALVPVPDAPRAFAQRHSALRARLGPAGDEPAWEVVRRRDLEGLYPEGYEARECQGVLEGRARAGGTDVRFLGIVGDKPLGCRAAWRFADLAWRVAQERPKTLAVLLDCASHAAKLEEESLILSEFVADMSLALATAARVGVPVSLTILGKAGGGVYVALAAPAARVASAPGADIQVLPGSAVAAILGESRDAIPSFESYKSSGVADDEVKLGIVP